MKLLFENWRKYLEESNQFDVKRTKDGFTLKLSVGGRHVGQYSHRRMGDNVSNAAEIFPEYRGKGYGTMMLLAAIEAADDLGIDFQEDSESLTPAMSRLYDELDNNRWIVGEAGYWTITDEGKEELENWRIKVPFKELPEELLDLYGDDLEKALHGTGWTAEEYNEELQLQSKAARDEIEAEVPDWEEDITDDPDAVLKALKGIGLAHGSASLKKD